MAVDLVAREDGAAVGRCRRGWWEMREHGSVVDREDATQGGARRGQEVLGLVVLAATCYSGGDGRLVFPSQLLFTDLEKKPASLLRQATSLLKHLVKLVSSLFGVPRDGY